MSVRIITDSTVDLPESKRQAVTAVPLPVRFGDEEFLDGVTLTKRQFYEKLAQSDALPTTSQASPASFQKVFEEVTRAGDTAVVITLSSKLSGTYQSACLAAEDYPGIFVVDSQSASTGSGVLAELALRLADEGRTAADIAATLTERRGDICLIATLDTLEYLKKGGRISKTVAFAGGLLNIKPVISITDGAVVLEGKARGSRQGNNLLVQKIREWGGIDFDLPILLGYTGLSDALLEKYVEDSQALWQEAGGVPESTMVCSVIGTHVGPGAVVASFFRKH